MGNISVTKFCVVRFILHKKSKHKRLQCICFGVDDAILLNNNCRENTDEMIRSSVISRKSSKKSRNVRKVGISENIFLQPRRKRGDWVTSAPPTLVEIKHFSPKPSEFHLILISKFLQFYGCPNGPVLSHECRTFHCS